MDKDIIKDPVLINNKSEGNKQILVFSNKNSGTNDYGLLKSNLSFNLKSEVEKDFNLNINGNQYGPYPLSEGIPNQFDFNLNLDDINNIVIDIEIIDHDDLSSPSPSPTSSDNINNFQLTEPKEAPTFSYFTSGLNSLTVDFFAVDLIFCKSLLPQNLQ